MKRKILSLLLCLSMAVGMLTGCGTKDVDATNDKVTDSSSVKVTKKLEEEYIARIEAYQDMLNNEYSDSDILITLTLDKESLPLLWLFILEDNDEDVKTTQLITVEDGETVILAERDEYIIPCRSQQIIYGVGKESETAYLYDEDKKDFRIINSEIDNLYQSETILSEEELEEAVNFLAPILESQEYLYSLMFAVNESTHQITYLANLHEDTLQDTLNEIGVIQAEYFAEADALLGYYLEDAYADNKVALKYMEQFPVQEVDEDTQAIRYAEYWCYNGVRYTKDELEDAYKNVNIFLSTGEWDTTCMKTVGYLRDSDIRTCMRVLKDNPAYTEEELCLHLASIKYNCEIVDIDIENYTLLDASDSYIEEVIRSYFGAWGSYDFFFTDELLNERDTLLDAETYKRMKNNGAREVSYENNVATIEIEDSDEVYQFQIEFTEVGDKISKITYIDPMASMSDEEKQAYKVKTEVLPAYEKYISENPMSTSQKPYSLIFMNDDTIPELVIQGDCEATGNMICTYIDNEVVSMYTSRLMFSYLEKQNLLNNCGGNMGSYYDRIFSIKDRAFECVYSGEWMESYDYDEGHVITDENGNILYEYLWDGQQVSSDEYNNSLAQVYDDDKAIWNYDLSYYSSIQEAYDNILNSPAVETSKEIVSEVYHDMMYSCEVFELDNQRLQIRADNFSVDSEISNDCVWQARYSDGSVYDSSYEDLHRIWENVLDSKQKLDEMGREYESPEGLGVEVKDGKVVAVYMTAS